MECHITVSKRYGMVTLYAWNSKRHNYTQRVILERQTMNTIEYWESQRPQHKTVDVTLTIDELKLIIGWGNIYLDHATVEEDEDGRLHARLEETLRETQS